MRRTLRNNKEVAHVWASQSQEYGKSKSMFFEGPSIFSYGYHFEMARIVKDDNGGTVVLFNPEKYSVTTSQHQRIVHSSIDHYDDYTVPSMTDHDANCAYLAKNVTDRIARLKRSRTGIDWQMRWIDAALLELIDYSRHFQGTCDVEKWKDFYKTNSEYVTAYELDVLYAREKRNEISHEISKKSTVRNELVRRNGVDGVHMFAIQEDSYRTWEDVIIDLTREAWVNGNDDYRLPHDGPTLLRIKDNEIETSRGAYVPVDEAVSLWHDMQSGVDIAGKRIGHYEISGVHDGKLVVGCHRIPLREMARMASKLGLEGGLR